MIASEYKVFVEIAEDASLNEEDSRKKFNAIINGEIEVEVVDDAPELSRGEKAAKTRKENKAKAEAKAIVDAEIEAAQNKEEEE